MTWQKITKHISDTRVLVKSRGGNEYPVKTPYDYMNDGIYRQMVNRANDHKTLWAWVEFGDGSPTLQDWVSRSGEGPPESPPWAHA